MRIAYIASGAGNMYCGTCLHDNALAAALIKKGHEVALVPTYTPLRTDEEDVSIHHVFYGGINVFLQQKSALFRHTPAVLDELLSRPSLLKWISRFGTSTDPKDLGPLTVSVLRGEEGNQKKELHKLVEWLKQEYKPELVHLNNSMFAGFARDMKKELGVPLLCSLQGEDLFLNELAEPYKTEALGILRERANDMDGFIATSAYYSRFMSQYLHLPEEKIHVVKLGLNLAGHGEMRTDLKEEPFVIGYLARICPEKGLHILVEAFFRLAEKVGAERIQLKVAGYLGKKDQAYCERILSRVDSSGLKNQFEFVGEVSRSQKIGFLNGLHALSVPTTYEEPKGLYVLEALANGVPVVQPRHGAFPELIEATGGGILVEPNSPEAVADGLSILMQDPEFRRQLGTKGKQAVQTQFSDQAMAEAMLAVFESYLSVPRSSSAVPL